MHRGRPFPSHRPRPAPRQVVTRPGPRATIAVPLVAPPRRFYVRSSGRASFDASFGSRWFIAQISAVVDGLVLLALCAFLGQRVRATVDRGRGAIELRRRLWPLPGVRFELLLAHVRGVEVRPASGLRF